MICAGIADADRHRAPERTNRQADVHLIRVGSFEVPVHVTAPPDDPSRLMIVEREGRIRVVLDGEPQRRPFLDIRRLVRQSNHEQGLLSLAFAPDYARSRLFYVYYTDRAGDQRVVEYRARTQQVAARGSARLVLRIADEHPTHNGGQLAFGPDHLLYIGTGDGGGVGDPQNNAQDLGSLWGKILRIDPRARGANFGWRPVEGTARYRAGEPARGHVEPVLVRSHRRGYCAIVGGVVVRDPNLPLEGKYIFGDLCRNRLLTAQLSPTGAYQLRATSLKVSLITSFGEDALGRVYVTSLHGRVYRIGAGRESAPPEAADRRRP